MSSELPLALKLKVYRITSYTCWCGDKECLHCYALYHCDHIDMKCIYCKDMSHDDLVEYIENQTYPVDFDELLENLEIETDTIRAFDKLEEEWKSDPNPPERGEQLKNTFQAIIRNYLIMGRQTRYFERMTRDPQTKIEIAKQRFADYSQYARLMLLTSTFWCPDYKL